MESAPVRVAICGIRGRMGRELAAGLPAYPGISVVGGCDPVGGTAADEPYPVVASLDQLLAATQPDVVVDFTVAEAAMANAECSLEARIPIVIGTTGLSDADLKRIDALATRAGVGAMVAPNFSIGAILLTQFARMASKYFDAAEVIEIHHEAKIDAPSGTALMIARAMREGRGRPFAGDNVVKHTVEGARGAAYEDLHVHSLRMPGFVATHEVVFGGPGQSLTLRHDAPGRESYLPGVAQAVTHIREHVGLVYGLDRLMDFS
ncbi:MAG: 4-hydroxy-tetrahydrodipicolinate reductase [Chloroflexi bacterium]|nr:4-hydroxy-tetrahydrodipicolinate reductase [Chloroflexota bacterium]